MNSRKWPSTISMLFSIITCANKKNVCMHRFFDYPIFCLGDLFSPITNRLVDHPIRYLVRRKLMCVCVCVWQWVSIDSWGSCVAVCLFTLFASVDGIFGFIRIRSHIDHHQDESQIWLPSGFSPGLASSVLANLLLHSCQSTTFQTSKRNLKTAIFRSFDFDSDYSK